MVMQNIRQDSLLNILLEQPEEEPEQEINIVDQTIIAMQPIANSTANENQQNEQDE